jgi:ubiquinol-cytochrome c reductase cytochrome b subunit
MGGYFLEKNNLMPANPLQTPPHITPLWYMAPYYAMLRAVPDKSLGIILVFAALFMWFLLPWLDKSPIASMRHRTWLSRIALGMFVVSFLGLIYSGVQPFNDRANHAALLLTALYFAYFLLMPFYSRYEKISD